jgi:hypothetical protein
MALLMTVKMKISKSENEITPSTLLAGGVNSLPKRRGANTDPTNL